MKLARRSSILVATTVLLLSTQVVHGLPGEVSPIPPPLAEGELLDIGVEVFDPGLGDGGPGFEASEQANQQVRESEAAFFAVLLVRALQDTGQFGRVRMVPRGSATVDLLARGRIHRSSGARLALQLEVSDSSGRRWLRRGYIQYAEPQSYLDSFESDVEPFQALYDQFAADLVRALARKKSQRLEELRQISELRYGARLAPALFSDYLKIKRKGKVVLQRLPAHDDPMLERLRRIRGRDELFLDLLTERYEAFYSEMNRPYDNYRATSFEAEMALRYARVQAYLANRISWYSGPRDFYRRKSPMISQREIYFRRQAALQARYLEDIVDTFAVVIEPLRLELDGEMVRFEGTIEDQYRQWQEMLEEIFVSETGLPIAGVSAPAAAEGRR